MKIETAKIQNFKLLRDIYLPFSINRDKPLTVIRAENGSGKTSTLQALRWALYGGSVLEDPTVRLSPADWPDQEPCPIAVEIHFIHSAVSNVGDELMVSETNYILKREVEETPNKDNPNRGQERVVLFKKTEAGSEPIDAPESYLKQMLPKEMIDIFFTDGDAAMTFISPRLSDSTKRDNVEEAIRSLLGLDLLNKVSERISITRTSVNRQIGEAARSNRLSTVTEEIEKRQKEKDQHEKNITDLNDQIKGINRNLSIIDKDLARALENGSYDHLAHSRNEYKEQLSTALKDEDALKRKHQELFQQESLSWNLIEPSLRNGFVLLQGLHTKGIIPKAAVPVLKDRLELGQCICGAELTEGSDAHTHVMTLVERQQKDDEQVDYLSSLYYQAKNEFDKWGHGDTRQWNEECNDITQQRISVSKRLESANRELRSIEAKLDQIDEHEIEMKREHQKTLESSLRQKNQDLASEEVSLHNAKDQLKSLHQELKELTRMDERLVELNAKKTALDDLEYVVSESLDEMQSTYLNRVSNRMNELFLDMIGADPEQGAIYQSAEINDEYNIVVNTMDGKTLHPDYEVNGASQRALTFAFIWALTEISGVVAPRVIDTPLGMMSGNVKNRVLDMISQPAGSDVDRQVILFLTQSEISHTEDILDERVGSAMTLIKTDDYPADLVNNPNVDLPEVRLCTCSHREYCDQCMRTNYEDFDLKYRTSRS